MEEPWTARYARIRLICGRMLKQIEQTIGPMLMHRDAYFALQERVDKIEKVEDDYHEFVEVLDAVDQFAQEVEESLRQEVLVKIKSRVTEKAKNIFKKVEAKGCTDDSLKLLRCFAEFASHGHFTSNSFKIRINDLLLNWQSASGMLAIGAAAEDTVRGGHVHRHDLKILIENLEGEHVPEDPSKLVDICIMLTRLFVNCPRVDRNFLTLVMIS